LFSYLGDQEKTKAAFDDEGFYKTGDIAELVGDELIFHGRERDDCKLLHHSFLCSYD
jgi:malonyl-CoA/methylmalonyl-CoA synthetase